jgi:hypothetical protein
MHTDRLLLIASLNYTERKNVQSSESMSVYSHDNTAINLSLRSSRVKQLSDAVNRTGFEVWHPKLCSVLPRGFTA